MTLLCVCEVDSFIPELEHLIEKKFHGLFSKKKPLKSDSWIQIHEMKLRSTSSAEENFADEITWMTWKTKQDLEIWPFLNSLLEKWVWENWSGYRRYTYICPPFKNMLSVDAISLLLSLCLSTSFLACLTPPSAEKICLKFTSIQ